MDIEVRLYHGLSKYLSHCDQQYSFRLEIAPGATLRRVIAELGLSKEKSILVFVNGSEVEWDYILKDGDVLAAMGPAAGG